MIPDKVLSLLEQAIASRVTLFDAEHESAFRLFNGFSEGYPDLTLDMYARTLVIYNHADDPTQHQTLIQDLTNYLRASINWLRAAIIKTRNSKIQAEKKGILTFGNQVDRKIKEHGIWYAIHLTMNRDASFYLDTCN